MSFMWLSFCDPDRPAGMQFLGCSIVEGDDIITAAKNALAHGCNPGGEVAGMEIPDEAMAHITPSWRNRLLTHAECGELDALVDRGLNQ